jgi:hypothetical protein
VAVAHILGDGRLETQAEVEARLAGDTRQGDLFEQNVGIANARH